MPTSASTPDVWFIYDGECPLCKVAAHALRIREAVGVLHLVNAREKEHIALLEDIRARGLNLDDGMVIQFQDRYYHGADALHIIALLCTKHGWFNRLMALLFRSALLAKLCYPFMRACRNGLLWLRGATPLNNLK